MKRTETPALPASVVGASARRRSDRASGMSAPGALEPEPDFDAVDAIKAASAASWSTAEVFAPWV
ncbi:MAG: hypothetical protein AAFP04_16145 [Myxococcota bacterium]